jgi:hypothetical protein
MYDEESIPPIYTETEQQDDTEDIFEEEKINNRFYSLQNNS